MHILHLFEHLVKAHSAGERLAPLLADPQGFPRKHRWEQRREPRDPWEQASWVRAVAFFAGEPHEWVSEAVCRARWHALATYHDRPEWTIAPGEDDD